MSRLKRSFFLADDVLDVSRDLLGKSLYTKVDGIITGGRIVETEGYAGAGDKACHAYGNRYTRRTKTMYARGGVAYIYLCYGIHHLLNIVTNAEDRPDAVLIRGIEPHTGIETMLRRRKMEKVRPQISRGPGNVSQALGLTRDMDGISVTGDIIWLADDVNAITPAKRDIATSPRIGVDYAEEFARKPWRFFLKDNKYVSR